MAEHNELGKWGESIAIDFLKAKGYTILSRNWKCGKLELDIVAKDNNEIVIIEVKTRRNNLFGNPEDAISDAKIRKIVIATDSYLKRYKIDNNVRFDVICILGKPDNYDIRHIEKAFYPPLL